MPSADASMAYEAYVRDLRRAELEEAARHFPPGARVLEIGGATGFQARLLHDMGFQVRSLDIAVPPTGRPLYEVGLYDGQTLPCADRAFDAVFSSNVLEHIWHLDRFEQEILRVLTQEGIAVHVVPTATWRMWTSLTHYAAALQRIARVLARQGHRNHPSAESRGRSLSARIGRVLWSGRHGELGSVLWEFWGFSRWSWSRHFRATGWSIRERRPLRLFYSGYVILGPRLSLSTRQVLSRFFGSSTCLFVLEKREGVMDTERR